MTSVGRSVSQPSRLIVGLHACCGGVAVTDVEIGGCIGRGISGGLLATLRAAGGDKDEQQGGDLHAPIVAASDANVKSNRSATGAT